MGPVWAYWAFPMERFCGVLQRSIKSRRFPFANLDSVVLTDARLKQLGSLYRLTGMLTLKGNPSSALRGQFQAANCEFSIILHACTLTIGILTDPTCVLLPPHLPKGKVNEPQLLRRIYVHFVTRLRLPFAAISRAISAAHIELFGKVRRLDGGDTMTASSMSAQTEDRRDTTHICVSLTSSWFQCTYSKAQYDILVDVNAQYRRTAEIFRPTTAHNRGHTPSSGPQSYARNSVYSC